MRNHSLRILGLAVAAVAVVSSAGNAQGKGHGNGKGKGNGDVHGNVDAAVMQGQKPAKHTKAAKRAKVRTDDGVTRLPDGTIVRDGRPVYGNGRKVPPGLAKKPGQMPPGQYKKRYGTAEGATVLGDIFGRHGYTVQQITPNGESQYVMYRRPDGTIGRAIVTPGTDRLGFSNVPASILREVIARLY